MVILQPIKPGAPRFALALKRGRARRALSLLGTNDAQQNLQLAESLLTISSEDFAKKWNFDPVREVPLEGGRFQWTPVAAPAARHSASENEDLQPCLSVPSLDLPRPGAAAAGVQEVVECRLVVASLEAGRPTCLSSAAPAHARAQAGESRPQRPDSAAAARRAAPAQSPRDGAPSAPRAAAEPTPAAAPAARVPSADAPPPAPQSEASTPAQPTPAEVTVSAEATPTETTSPASPTPAAALSLRQTCITDFVRPRKRRSVSLESHYHVPHKKALLQLRA